uniref:Phosphofructokinase domain-containing protein n=1 Tax=Aegilops tauschii subsp. strangulata TaxID=200361 RepID=A0A453QPR8_AEGTS
PQSEHNGALPRGRFPPCRRRRPTPPPLIPTRPPTPTPAGPATPPPQSPSPARGNLCTGTCTTCSTAAREAQRATPAMDGTPPPKPEAKLAAGEAGYVLEDVPHVSDYLPDLPTYPNPLQDNTAYSVVKQYFVDPDDTVCQKIVVHKDGPRGNHFRRAGPRQRVYFEPDEVHACIVTCGGLCPGLNTVIREIVCGLSDMYGVTKILGIQGGYRGFYARNTIDLTPKSVNDIHKRGGTILGSSRGGHDTMKIVDSIQYRGINQVK